MWGSRRGRDETKEASASAEALEGMAGSGVRRSEAMVMGRAKSEAFEVKSAKAVWRSSDAGSRGKHGQMWICEAKELKL